MKCWGLIQREWDSSVRLSPRRDSRNLYWAERKKKGDEKFLSAIIEKLSKTGKLLTKKGQILNKCKYLGFY